LESTADFDAKAVRTYLCKRGFLSQNIVRHCYRPFDVRWLYWEPETSLLHRNSAEYVAHVFEENVWIVSQQKVRREWSKPQFIRSVGCKDLMDRNASCIPLHLHVVKDKDSLFFDSTRSSVNGLRFNVSDAVIRYLADIEAKEENAEDLFYHTLAILHAPAYEENAGALRQDWPRLPLPESRKELLASAALGRQIAVLLDTETSVPGVTSGTIRPELKPIAVISQAEGKSLNPDAGDLDVTAGWGHGGKGGVTMPGKGKVVERDYTPEEQAAAVGATGRSPLPIGETTCDIYLNNLAYWKNVPTRVWDYTIGGYQVMKKWLSYRERALLGRSLTADEAREVRDMARRIAAILLLEPELDANYQAIKQSFYTWPAVAAKQ